MPLTSLIVWLLLIGPPTTLQAGSTPKELAISLDRPAQAEHWPATVDRPAILIGHRSGGVQPALLLKAHPDLAVDQLLLVSWLAASRDSGVGVHAVAGANHLLDLANPSGLFDRVPYMIAGSRHG